MHSHDTCDHCHNSESSKQEAFALLQYMLSHNKHHADELHDLAHSLDGEARELVHAAVIDLETGNGKLQKALSILKKGETG